MRTTRSIRRAVAIGLGAATVATTAAAVTAGPAHADSTGVVCHTNRLVAVRSAALTDATVEYILGTGRGFDILYISEDFQWYYGHGNGHADGWVPYFAISC